MRWYTYRCTTEKLEHHLNRVQAGGDVVFATQYMGGRDWLLVCHTSEPRMVEVRALGDAEPTYQPVDGGSL